MTLYYNNNGTWETVNRPFVKVGGVHKPVTDAYVKVSGSWEHAYEHDTTPSSPPEVSLQLIQNRYIKVGIRLPGGANDTDLKRVRVLVSRKEQPKTQFGTGFLYEPDTDWKNEPWSDWWYNDSNPASNQNHLDSSDFDYKQYPVNPTANTNLPGGQYYYFSAWTEDENGNWSVGTFSKIWMPKTETVGQKVIKKEANIQATAAGSAGVDGASYDSGKLIVRESPRSDGFWFYGNKIGSLVGEQGQPTVTSAKIRITRENDTGQPAANVRLFWHEEQSESDMPMNDSLMNDITLLGTINKGESKWFDVPASYLTKFNTQLKGFGLVYGIQASDYLEVSGLGTDMRCGEVNIVWEEEL